MTEDAVAVLEDEHASLESLFNRVSSPDEDRKEVLKELMQTLALHVSLEKQMLLPVLDDDVPDGSAMADRIRDDHDHVEKILTHLERRKLNSPDVPDLVNELLAISERHITEANSTVLPGLRSALSTDQLAQLGERMISDERHMHTHAHPIMPDQGPIADLTAKLAQVLDGRRDRSEGGMGGAGD